MKTLWMGNNSIEEHNARFKMIVTRSELNATSPAVIDYYRETLNIPLQKRILSLENLPKTLQEWYNWAAKLDNNWRKMQRILGRSRESNDRKDSNGKKKEEPRRRFNFVETLMLWTLTHWQSKNEERWWRKDYASIARNLVILAETAQTNEKQELCNPHHHTLHQYQPRNCEQNNYTCTFVPSLLC